MNVSFFIFAPGLSAVSFLVASAVVVFILILVGVVASAIKRRNSLSSTRVKVYKTRPGITIKVSPATPIENRSKASLHNDTVTDSNLVLPKETRKFPSWMKRGWDTGDKRIRRENVSACEEQRCKMQENSERKKARKSKRMALDKN